MNTAIIVAAGTGTRFGSGRAKQFLDILGKPVIIHTIERFEKCGAIDEIVLVLSNTGREEFDDISSKFSFSKLKSIVTGGATRVDSVRRGFDAVDTASDVVLVHDGARPLVTCSEIGATVELALETGAACLVGSVTDTIKRVDGSVIAETIDRSSLRRALTPQAFRYDILKRAVSMHEPDDNATDECYLVEKLGVIVSFVEGSSRNIKITHADDLSLAEFYLRQEAKVV